MALIICPECKGQVSSSARVCPHCGYRLRGILGNIAYDSENESQQKIEDNGIVKFSLESSCGVSGLDRKQTIVTIDDEKIEVQQKRKNYTIDSSNIQLKETKFSFTYLSYLECVFVSLILLAEIYLYGFLNPIYFVNILLVALVFLYGYNRKLELDDGKQKIIILCSQGKEIEQLIKEIESREKFIVTKKEPRKLGVIIPIFIVIFCDLFTVVFMEKLDDYCLQCFTSDQGYSNKYSIGRMLEVYIPDYTHEFYVEDGDCNIKIKGTTEKNKDVEMKFKVDDGKWSMYYFEFDDEKAESEADINKQFREFLIDATKACNLRDKIDNLSKNTYQNTEKTTKERITQEKTTQEETTLQETTIQEMTTGEEETTRQSLYQIDYTQFSPELYYTYSYGINNLPLYIRIYWYPEELYADLCNADTVYGKLVLFEYNEADETYTDIVKYDIVVGHNGEGRFLLLGGNNYDSQELFDFDMSEKFQNDNFIISGCGEVNGYTVDGSCMRMN